MSSLDKVWEWYEAARDSMDMALRLLQLVPSNQIPPNLIRKGSVFALQPQREALQRLRKAQQELDDLTIVARFATFEQEILDHFESVVNNTIQSERNSMRQLILKKRLQDPRFWRLKDILDFYKTFIKPDIIGLINQIYDYRSWVAHGRRGMKPVNLKPKRAYERLKGFLELLKQP